MKHYIVIVHVDDGIHFLFSTSNKEKAERYRNKFNRVAETAQDWLQSFDAETTIEKGESLPFHYWERKFDDILCKVREVKFLG